LSVFEKPVAWLDDIAEKRASMKVLTLPLKPPHLQLYLWDAQGVGLALLLVAHYGAPMWMMTQMIMIEVRSDHLDAFP
jgi:hypothetical protein